MSSEFICLRSSGNEFHNLGAATEKARLPNLVLDTATSRSIWDCDLRLRAGWYKLIMLQRYGGAWPLMHLNVVTANLYEMRCLIGNQWRAYGSYMFKTFGTCQNPCSCVLDAL